MNRQKITGLYQLHELLNSYGDPNVKIAVLDGPVDTKHPCFNIQNNAIVPYVSGEGVFPSGKGLAKYHGTAVASLIFGKPDKVGRAHV